MLRMFDPAATVKVAFEFASTRTATPFKFAAVRRAVPESLSANTVIGVFFGAVKTVGPEGTVADGDSEPSAGTSLQGTSLLQFILVKLGKSNSFHWAESIEAELIDIEIHQINKEISRRPVDEPMERLAVSLQLFSAPKEIPKLLRRNARHQTVMRGKTAYDRAARGRNEIRFENGKLISG